MTALLVGLVVAIVVVLVTLALAMARVAALADREIQRQYDELEKYPDDPVGADWSGVRHGGLGR